VPVAVEEVLGLVVNVVLEVDVDVDVGLTEEEALLGFVAEEEEKWQVDVDLTEAPIGGLR
jgi:hypothetical protein